MTQPTVLVLSLHQPHIDRRIVHQINALCESGRHVLLLSAPASIPRSVLDARTELVMDEPAEEDDTPPPLSRLARFGRKVPQPFRRWGGRAYSALLMSIPKLFRDPYHCEYFLSRTPQRNYVAIHCHDLHTLPAALLIRRQLAPAAKVIYDSHELFPYQIADKKFQRHWSMVVAGIIGQADQVITVNDSIADDLAQRYSIPRPEVLYNSYEAPPAPAVSRADFFAKFGASPDGFNVLFQGYLTDGRKVERLLDAFASLDPSYRLFIIGTGPDEPRLRAHAAKLQLTNAFFSGWIDQAELAGYTQHADLGIIHYQAEPGVLNTTYCTPNKLFEFIETRIPICASDLPELRKIVQDRGIGRVYPLWDAPAITAAVIDMRTRLARGEFPRATRDAVREELSWRKQAEKLLAIYDKLSV
jgi:glycosyltransferase involved in cell wall biosynthesis